MGRCRSKSRARSTCSGMHQRISSVPFVRMMVAGSFLTHPDAPRERPGLLIGHRAARHLEGQLHLTVMVALVPEHVLKQQDRVIVVKVHVPTCLHSALYRIADRLRAVVQHLRDATRVTLDYPLFLGQVSGELGGILEDEHKSYEVDVCEQLRDAWAAFDRPGLQA